MENVLKTKKSQENILSQNIKGTSILERKIELCIEHNIKGQREGWLRSTNCDGSMISPYHISLSPYSDEAKVSKELEIYYPSLDAQDVPYLISLLNTPFFWWREHERRCLWNVVNSLIGVPKEIIYLDEINISNAVMTSTSMLGKVINSRGGADLNIYSSAQYFEWVAAPEDFTKLFEFASNGLQEGVVNEGDSYQTVRFGTVRSGACSRFTFNLLINELFYAIELYGSDRGGNPTRPSRYGIDLSVKKLEESTTEADFTFNSDIDNEVIFRNLARKLGANYPLRESGIPLAGQN